ncbi:MAG: GerW family sporulation protein [bacterium]
MSDSQMFLENLYGKLEKFLKTETIIGEPIEAGDVNLIPVISASFGMGGGLGLSENGSDKDEGGGGGLGARITPTAILVIQENDVKLVTLEGKGSLDKLVDMVPELMDKAKDIKQDLHEKEEEKPDEEDKE